METVSDLVTRYLNFCKTQKRLSGRTLKAYRIDLNQFTQAMTPIDTTEITSDNLEDYISALNASYKPKTVKRKLAAIKTFFSFLEYKKLIESSPFSQVKTRLRDTTTLPRTIPLHNVELLLQTIYNERAKASTTFQQMTALKNIAITEMLFSTGIRISELCSLKAPDVDLVERTILLYGKGSKERRIYIGNEATIIILICNDLCQEVN